MTNTRPRRPRHLLRLLLGLVVGSVVLTGCNFSVYSLPLPGGADLGDHPYTVTADFVDALDLVPKSAVKVDDISVGRISDIKLQGQTAVVTMEINGDTKLPDDTYAKIRQTSLLGEKFVSLEPPPGGGSGQLSDGDTIGLDHTNRNPEVEEVLGALSLILNGGGVAQLKTIAQEINTTLGGREDSVRDVLSQISTLTGQLDDHRGDIVRAIDSLNRLAVSVKGQQRSIDTALADLPSALDSIDRQRAGLVKVLQSLDRLSGVGVQVIKRSKESTFEVLRQLQPTLTQLANSGDAFVNSISTALTPPFIDDVVGRDPQVARNIGFGDYVNLSAEVDLDLNNLPDLPGLPCTTLQAAADAGSPIDLTALCEGAQHALARCVNHPSAANCAAIPAGIVSSICDSLTVPIPLLCGSTGTKGRHHGNGGGLPGIPNLPIPGVPGGLGGLTGGLVTGLGSLLSGGSGRAPFGAPAPTSGGLHTTTLRRLTHMFDPALVTLLTPGMVLK